MPLLQIALDRDGLCDMTRGMAAVGALSAAAAGLPGGATVVVMVHRRGHAPGAAGACPHDLLYAARVLGGGLRRVSGSRRLGLAGPGGGRYPGLAVGFGWDAQGTIWRVARGADAAAPGLARLVTLIRRARPGAPVDLMGDTLGARVILGAGADFVDHAQAARRRGGASGTCRMPWTCRSTGQRRGQGWRGWGSGWPSPGGGCASGASTCAPGCSPAIGR
jgi:hypothetical protein